MPKRANARAVKSMRTYTIEEAAELLSVSIVTVRSWEARGLHLIKDQRPYLIVGSVLKEFLLNEAASRKRPLAEGQFYCAPCRQPVKPMGDMADYVPTTAMRGQLAGLCADCERPVQLFVNQAKLIEYEAVLDVAVRRAECP
ncbi:hypothetical protein [Ahrensia sp. R2A130]|uniref:hypothetical protein n=1 Tax=Ahrensia sp. R2A130 TaxID=744979 RepID=UPI00058D3826|nr:hypothetical protein [Ahrensia sp. R2A130]